MRVTNPSARPNGTGPTRPVPHDGVRAPVTARGREEVAITKALMGTIGRPFV